MAGVDIALLVPMQAEDMDWLDPVVRRTRSPSLFTGVRALQRLEELIGRRLRVQDDAPRRFRGAARVGRRTLGAVVLATSLERAGLRWHVCDPGVSESLPVWRRRIQDLARLRPTIVAINTTFILDVGFAGVLCALVRRYLPDTALALGGYLYSSDTRGFLELDADVLCIGEGERRIVEITRRLLGKQPLDDVPGLYLRHKNGELSFTGPVEPLILDELPLPDWALARRMDPPVELSSHETFYHVETQRGCVFKCAYCTFRTVSAPAERSVENAARAILHTGSHGPGRIWVVDPTLTFPRERCKAILHGLCAAGGSPIPLLVYARVTDLDDEMCALMAQVGVKDVFIGQESGDQRILNRMRKGTRIEHVRPAMEAMARHGLCARYSFIFGFPGEDAESAARTRALIASLNQGFDRRVATYVTINLFRADDFSAVAQEASVRSMGHRFAYDAAAMDARRASEEVLATYIALARRPDAPASGFGVLPFGDTSDAMLRWQKAVDEALACFVELDLEGKRPRPGQLDDLRRRILAPYDEQRAPPSILTKAGRELRRRLVGWLRREWEVEHERGPGIFTQILVSGRVWEVTRDASLAYRAGRAGSLPRLGTRALENDDARARQLVLADDLLQFGVATGRRKRTLVVT